jgi:citrate lyase subunit beta/citryl-CoA lyase
MTPWTPTTLLYVPGDRPDRVAKAIASDADTVIVDLEDAVPVAAKPRARETVRELLAAPPDRPVQVRVNDVRTSEGAADLGLLRDAPVEVRVPKVESPSDVLAVVSALPRTRLHCLIESALGLERAYEIASAHPAVASVGLGEADLAVSLGVDSEEGLSFARSRVVVAAAAAGLPPPTQSAHLDLHDLAGLRESCLRGRRLGFAGRAAIHPRQLPVIRDAYRPSAGEVDRARSLLAQVAGRGAAEVGAVRLADGRFVDAAVVRAAERTVRLADREA